VEVEQDIAARVGTGGRQAEVPVVGVAEGEGAGDPKPSHPVLISTDGTVGKHRIELRKHTVGPDGPEGAELRMHGGGAGQPAALDKPSPEVHGTVEPARGSSGPDDAGGQNGT